MEHHDKWSTGDTWIILVSMFSSLNGQVDQRADLPKSQSFPLMVRGKGVTEARSRALWDVQTGPRTGLVLQAVAGESALSLFLSVHLKHSALFWPKLHAAIIVGRSGQQSLDCVFVCVCVCPYTSLIYPPKRARCGLLWPCREPGSSLLK